MKTSFRNTAILPALLALSTLLAAPGRAEVAEGSFARTLKVTGPVDLDVKTGSGDIDVRTGDASSVSVRGRIRVHDRRYSREEAERKVQYLESNPPVEQDGNRVRVGHIEDPALRRGVSISYEITVPAETRVTSHTGSGNQTLTGVRGPVRAETGSGNIRASSIGDTLRAHSGSGDLELDSINGDVYAETGSGNIRAMGIEGAFVGSTGSGDVKVHQTAAGSVKVETGSGNAEVSGARGSLELGTGSGNISATGEPSGAWKLEAGSGNVTLRLPSQAAFDLHAHTGSGSIESDHPITVQGKLNRHELRGKVRGGGALVEVGTGSGNIRIE